MRLTLLNPASDSRTLIIRSESDFRKVNSNSPPPSNCYRRRRKPSKNKIIIFFPQYSYKVKVSRAFTNLHHLDSSRCRCQFKPVSQTQPLPNSSPQTTITPPDQHPDSSIPTPPVRRLTPPDQSCFKFADRRTSSHFIPHFQKKNYYYFFLHPYILGDKPAHHLSHSWINIGKVQPS